jgi:hypothetical protein
MSYCRGRPVNFFLFEPISAVCPSAQEGRILHYSKASRLPQNRDRTGASNIGMQFFFFARLFTGRGPIRSMTAEDLELHRHSLCLECDED